jgi:hypothetical protein
MTAEAQTSAVAILMLPSGARNRFMVALRNCPRLGRMYAERGSYFVGAHTFTSRVKQSLWQSG